MEMFCAVQPKQELSDHYSKSEIYFTIYYPYLVLDPDSYYLFADFAVIVIFIIPAHHYYSSRKGGKRRLVIPAKLGYKTKEQLPIPRQFGDRQRLYSTVLNR